MGGQHTALSNNSFFSFSDNLKACMMVRTTLCLQQLSFIPFGQAGCMHKQSLYDPLPSDTSDTPPLPTLPIPSMTIIPTHAIRYRSHAYRCRYIYRLTLCTGLDETTGCLTVVLGRRQRYLHRHQKVTGHFLCSLSAIYLWRCR